MPRKRIIDPEFWGDEEIATKWSYEARLFYIGLWNFADDEGYLKAHPDLLKAQIFPYDKKIKVEKMKEEVSKKVEWYEVEEQQYGKITNFLKYQRIDRPSPSRIPKFVESSASLRRHIVPNISKVKLSKVKLSKNTNLKIKYAENVEMTEVEHNKLIQTYGKYNTEKLIETLDNAIGAKGYKYKSHYRAILVWVVDKLGIKPLPPPAKKEPEPKEEDKLSAEEMKKLNKFTGNLTKNMDNKQTGEKTKAEINDYFEKEIKGGGYHEI